MISNRLKSITKYIKKTDNVIDIGCDHALLDIYLINNNILDSIIVSDVSKAALDQGINNINKYNLNKKIDARCGYGLEVLNEKDSVDTIVISGMGTNTILKILDNPYLKNIKKLIIQSNNDYELLRCEINKLGFIITNDEALIDKNKLYLNIVFIKGNKKYTNTIYKYGLPNMINKELYYNHLINKYTKILKNKKDDKLIHEIEYLSSLLK